MCEEAGDPRPIGVFDSGVGGLTVARALMDLLPDERLVYLGDTARSPFGPRPLAEVRRFTEEITEWLVAEDVKLVVAACNTASAAAVERSPIDTAVPLVGVVEPAAAEAVRTTRSGRVGVIGTLGTIASGAYEQAVARISPDVELVARACPDFVTLAEHGRTTDPEVRHLAEIALAPLRAAGVDTLILGCTHYPLLTGVISYVMGEDVLLVSSAEATARAVFRLLVDRGSSAFGVGAPRAHRFAVTGDGASFGVLAARFLGPRIADLDGGAARVEPGVRVDAQRVTTR